MAVWRATSPPRARRILTVIPHLTRVELEQRLRDCMGAPPLQQCGRFDLGDGERESFPSMPLAIP